MRPCCRRWRRARRHDEPIAASASVALTSLLALCSGSRLGCVSQRAASKMLCGQS